MSDISRFTLEISSAWRVPSIEKLRSSGCENCRFRLPLVAGLKAFDGAFEVWRPRFQAADRLPPVGRNWLRPAWPLAAVVLRAVPPWKVWLLTMSAFW